MTAIDAEFVQTGSALATRTDAPPSLPSLFNTDDPEKFVEWTTKVANALVRVIEAKGLAKSLNRQKPDDKFVELEGWQLLGGMTKVYAVVEWTKEREDGWEARAQAFTLDGALVGAGEAVCLNTERNWKGRDSYAIKGMAQTRAMSRALRAPLGFIMTLAGYRATSAEEMPAEPAAFSDAPKPAPAPQDATTGSERPANVDLNAPGSITPKQKDAISRGVGRLSWGAAAIATLYEVSTKGRVSDPDRMADLSRSEAAVVIEKLKSGGCADCGALLLDGESHRSDDLGPCLLDTSDDAMKVRAADVARDRNPIEEEFPQ